MVLSILTVLILSGALEGLIGNYYRRHKPEPDVEPVNLLVSVFLGIGAFMLVPVLLNILTSNILSEIYDNPEKAFILAGFCLTAAISAETFIEGIIQKFNEMGGNMVRDSGTKPVEILSEKE